LSTMTAAIRAARISRPARILVAATINTRLCATPARRVPTPRVHAAAAPPRT
jgi:hypothetical protein